MVRSSSTNFSALTLVDGLNMNFMKQDNHQREHLVFFDTPQAKSIPLNAELKRGHPTKAIPALVNKNIFYFFIFLAVFFLPFRFRSIH